MKFEDVKRLPPELQPLAREMAQLTVQFTELRMIVQNLDDDVRMLRALIQQFMKMVEDKPGEDSHVQQDRQDDGTGSDRIVPEGQPADADGNPGDRGAVRVPDDVVGAIPEGDVLGGGRA